MPTEISERGCELQAMADRQIAELLALITTLDEETARRPCPGRDKLGDGTVAASARHMAENYGRIAAFLMTSEPASAEHTPPKLRAHRIPRAFRSHGDPRSDHGAHPTGANAPYTADNTDLAALARALSTTRDAMAQATELTDRQLDTIPAAGSFRFCDGRRTLEQVLASLLKHQAHQLGALNAAVE